MIEIIVISVFIVILVYFLFPAFIELCGNFGGAVAESVEELINVFIEAFIEAKNEWKELLRWWGKND